jgi:uncharacterized membrane-anchored protein
MRRWVITACVAGQLAVLAYMVYAREAVIHGGTRVVIATAPVDPRDPFRGDYVRLRYGLNSLHYAPTRWQPADYAPAKGDKVYAILEPRPGGLHDVSYFTNLAPESGSSDSEDDTHVAVEGVRDPRTLFLQGRIRQVQSWAGTNSVDVSFGIEQLYVEQGSGLSIEERRGVRGGLQTAMHAHIALGTDGTAILTGHGWSPLAIGIEITPSFPLHAIEGQMPAAGEPDVVMPDTDAPSSEQPPSPLILTVTNTSEEGIILNNPGNDCGFRLESAARATSHFVEPEGVCAGLSAEPVRLAPDQSLVMDLDLADPRWHMTLVADDVARTADVRGFTDNIEAFRLVYRSDHFPDRLPSAVDRPESSVFWQGDLVSQSFSSQGQID